MNFSGPIGGNESENSAGSRPVASHMPRPPTLSTRSTQRPAASPGNGFYSQQDANNIQSLRSRHHVSLPPLYYATENSPTSQYPTPNFSNSPHLSPNPQTSPLPPQPPQLSQASPQAFPRLRRIQSWSQLKPSITKVPKTRRAKPEGGFMSPLMALTTYLPATYSICDPKFQYNQSKNPRRVLTEPHEAHLNNGFDNSENDYILYVNDVLGTDENRRYLALDLLGKGTFGQVVKCQNMATMEIVAVKVIKNKPAFLNQSMMEVSVLEHIQQSVDRDDQHNLLRLKDRFMHKEHLCLVFELLSLNLYEVIKKNEFRGLGINVVRVFAQQLLDSLSVLKSANLIHCDLKPENILLKRHDTLAIKVIDFGSACHERQTVYTYIQSRFYRSPEVILGLPYTSSIDMWSLGCIIAELFLGLPIFPGSSEYNQWCRIVTSLGAPPQWMMDMGKNTSNFMTKNASNQWRLRTIEEQNALFNTQEKDGRRYFATTNVHDTIMNYPMWKSHMSPAELDEEMKQRECLSDFVSGLLNFNPFERWTPQQAVMHPFISRQQYVGPFSPQASLGSLGDSELNNRLPPFQDASRYHSAHSLAHAQAAAQAQVQAQLQNNNRPQYAVAPPQMPMIQIQPMRPEQSQVPNAQIPQPQVTQSQLAQSQFTQPQVQMVVPPVRSMQHPVTPSMHPHMNQSSQMQMQPQMPMAPYIPASMPLNTMNQHDQSGAPSRYITRFGQQPLRGRAATIGQVNTMVPEPIQQAASRVNPNEVIQGHNSPAYFPPNGYY